MSISLYGWLQIRQWNWLCSCASCAEQSHSGKPSRIGTIPCGSSRMMRCERRCCGSTSSFFTWPGVTSYFINVYHQCGLPWVCLPCAKFESSKPVGVRISSAAGDSTGSEKNKGYWKAEMSTPTLAESIRSLVEGWIGFLDLIDSTCQYSVVPRALVTEHKNKDRLSVQF